MVPIVYIKIIEVIDSFALYEEKHVLCSIPISVFGKILIVSP